MKDFSGSLIRWTAPAILLAAALGVGLNGCQGGGSGVEACNAPCPNESGRNPATVNWKLDNLPPSEQLDSSRLTLTYLKKSTGNSYSYRVDLASVFGFGSTTWIKVEGGIAIERKFDAYEYLNGTRKSIEERAYLEKGADVGKALEGFPPKTLDLIYKECGEYLAKAGSGTQVFFALDSNFIVERCGGIPRGCQDDCFEGVGITGLTWGR